MKYNEVLNGYLTESGIRIPPNTHAAKIVAHSDMDGFFSALLTYHQLMKQGIDGKNITINFVQYGDEESDLLKKVSSKKGQMVSVVDFSALPTMNIFDTLNKAFDYKAKPKFFITFSKLIKNKKPETFEEFKKLLDEHWGKTFSDEDAKKIQDGFRKFDFSKLPETATEDEIKKVMKVKITEPDFVSDHHDNEADSLTKGKSGSIGKTEYKSDTEHIAVAYAQNLMGYDNIKAVSMVDSAGYPNLMDTLTLPKDFKSKGRMERLATILNTLIPDLLKRNKEAVKNVVKASSPSLASVYNNILKYAKLSDVQQKAMKELEKEQPDWGMIDSIRSQLPKNMALQTKKEGEKPGETKTIESWREKGKEDLENARKGSITGTQKKRIDELSEKKDKTPEENEELKKLKEIAKERSGKFFPVGAAIRQDATSLKGYPSRYTGALLQDKEGKRWGILVKRFNTMIQFSANPELPEDKKKKLDLIADMRSVIQKAKERYMTFSNKWAFEVIESESGGHKFIANVSGLGTLGLLKRDLREEFKALEALKERSGGKFEKLMPNKYARYKALKEQKETAAKQRKEIMNFIETELYKIFKEKYGDIRFADKPTGMTIKESMMNFR